MTLCKYCQTENSDDAKFCKKCGKRMAVINCPYCHKENSDDAVFCEECGKSLVDFGKEENIAAYPLPNIDRVSEKVEESTKIPQKIKPADQKKSIIKKPLKNALTSALIFAGIMTGIGLIIEISMGDDFIFLEPYYAISNFLGWGFLYSLITVIWRRFIKKQVKTLKDPDSGISALLIFGGSIFILILFMVSLLLVPALSGYGNTLSNGCNKEIVGDWTHYFLEAQTYITVTLLSDGRISITERKAGDIDVSYSEYSCVGSKIIVKTKSGSTALDYSFENGNLILDNQIYTPTTK